MYNNLCEYKSPQIIKICLIRTEYSCQIANNTTQIAVKVSLVQFGVICMPLTKILLLNTSFKLSIIKEVAKHLRIPY